LESNETIEHPALYFNILKAIKKINIMEKSLLTSGIIIAIFFSFFKIPVITSVDIDIDLENPSTLRLGITGNSSSSMMVQWQTTSINTTTTVYHGKSRSSLNITTNGTMIALDTGYLHEVLLEGLEPGTTYFYKAGGESGNSTVKNFTTAPGPGTSGISFVATGDTRTNRERRVIVRDMIETKFPGNASPALVLNSGDVVSRGDQQELYDNYSSDMESLASSVPIMHVAGNHDINDRRSRYPVHFSEPSNGNDGWYYSFDWGPVHFIALNTEDMGGGNNDPEFLEWLENDLVNAANDSRILWIVGFFHQPLYASFSHESRSDLWWTWNKKFTEHGVDVLFTGHCHGYQRNYPINQYGVINKIGDPHYVDPDEPIHVISGAGAVNSGNMTADELRNDTFIATREDGGKVFFPSNHFCAVNVSVDRESMKTILNVTVVGLDHDEPGISLENYNTSVVDEFSISKTIPEGWFIEAILNTTILEPVSVAWIVVVAISFTGLVIISGISFKNKKREKKT
jgi:predicted phosphodiesterase